MQEQKKGVGLTEEDAKIGTFLAFFNELHPHEIGK